MRTMRGWLWVSAMVPLSLGGAAARDVDFNRDVRPILNQHCTACHGGVKQAGNISFNYREKALGKGKSGEVIIVPGRPAQSALFRRVTSKDPDERMPPPGRGERRALSAAEVEVLRQWIAGGATWGEHWAYRKPVSRPVPRARPASWSHSDVDRFILARLDAEGLRPSPEADRAQWLRRAALDLTGIPPTLDELSAFWRDLSPRAYENAAERYLASPAFGERWAALWMDLARYADTQGYEKDNHRDMWPYRDWLIRAFNADMPFDEFTIRQLAGDLLPEATLDDRIATGFHRNTQTNTEGGTDDEEFRLLAVIDRVNTTWTVWQATTFGCIQCHSHPYEPFPHEDYYRFLSFFNNTEDADLGDDFPRLKVPKDAEKFGAAAALDAEIARLRAQLNDAGLPLVSAETWAPAKLGTITGAREARFTVTSNEVVVDGTVGNGTTYVIPMNPSGLTALRLDILPRQSDPKMLPENGAVVGQLWLELELPPDDAPAAAATVATEGGSGGSSSTNTTGAKAPVRRIDFAAVFADELTGPFDPEESLKPGGPGGGAFPKIYGPRWLVFVPKEPVQIPDGAQARLQLKHDISDNETKGSILYHFKLSATTNAAWTKLVASNVREELKRRWEEARKKRNDMAAASTLVMQERPAPARRETRLFVRGNFLAKDQLVEPGVPGLFPPLPARQTNRLAMARWLVSPENPLTARVLVNRIWAELFGLGFVETVEDFGSTGMAPSHPELLDYLALHFQNELKWSIKALLRELVLSSAYRQDHRATPKMLAKDPRNRLLAHGPRTRLTAEMVRDQALQAAGVLSRKVGGPSVMPPQPDGVWQVVYNGSKWETPKGEDRYRRGLYTYWRRTSPYPSFMTFDASSREVCTARRLVTNTPLQALVTLNDPVYFEAAQALAVRMAREGGVELSRRLTLGWRLVTTADPKATDIERLFRLYNGALSAYRKDPALSAKAGETPELAALALVASTLLNLDEALTK